MKKWTLLLCIALLAASCNSILKSKPSGTLSESKMIDVLVDIHLTEATLRIAYDTTIRLNDTTNLRIRFAEAFRKNKVTPDDFNTSLNYYIKHIEELDKIYVEVINRLTEMEASLLQKTSRKATNLVELPSNGQIKPSPNNPWFRSLNKDDETEEIPYFDTLKYPVSSYK